jgi:hypothetical protein
MIQEEQGQVTQTHSAAASGSTVEVDCYGFNSLIIWHEISGSPATGGHVTLENRHTSGSSGVAHPAPAGDGQFGANVKDADSTTSYVSIYRGVSRYVGVILAATDGTHNVRVLPVNL